MSILNPIPNGNTRRKIAKRIREKAASIADHRAKGSIQRNNGDADRALSGADSHTFVAAHGTFTKGLSHDQFGRVRAGDLKKLIDGLNQKPVSPASETESPFPGVYAGPGAGKAAAFDVVLHAGGYNRPSGGTSPRAMESPLSGHCFDLLGADSDALGMPPAPALGSDELIAEMAEVYGAALIRDCPFSDWSEHAKVAEVSQMLAALPYFSDDQEGSAEKRRAARGQVSPQNLFRGSTPGAKVGPYISQFLLVGNAERPQLSPDDTEFGMSAALATPSQDAVQRASSFVPSVFGDDEKNPEDGFIRYGIQTVWQQFAGHLEGVDHMTEWETWHDVQNGSNRKDVYDRYEEQPRFIATPRDLATYVHFDALYQAYLNACLILIGGEQPTDLGLPEGFGHATRDGFATFGTPHVLTLVTEVATRALKAVRRQKYNIHLRGRPEAVAAAIALSWTGHDAEASLGEQSAQIGRMRDQLQQVGMLDQIGALNSIRNSFWEQQYGSLELGPLTQQTNSLLPMAFPEGSPMHPAYGAGHATVAGACTTILKAFFEMYALDGEAPARGEVPLYNIISKDDGYPAKFPAHLFGNERALTGVHAMLPSAFEPDAAQNFQALKPSASDDLTCQGELEKLAANISIGRNFAGVHYYSDYYESLRLGERIAVTMLQEQMLTYREPISMRFRSFDDDYILIAGTGGSRGSNDALVCVWDTAGNGGTEEDYQSWLTRHQNS